MADVAAVVAPPPPVEPPAPKPKPTPPPASMALEPEPKAAPASMVLTQEHRNAIFDAARSRGTHSDVVEAVCGECGQLCDGYWLHLAGGGGGVTGNKWLCKSCADRRQLAPVARSAPTAAAKVCRATRPKLNLQDVLLLWGMEHYPEAVVAIRRSEDAGWHDRCLAAIFRAWADRQPSFPYEAVERFEADVRRLAPVIGAAAGYRLTDEWLDAASALAGGN